jgi:hemolysin activation/secretion protein
MWFANFELRARFAETKWLKQHFSFALVPFFDAGTVRDSWQELNFANIRYAYGAGFRIGWNQSTILSLDYGISSEDKLLFFGLGQIF